MKGKILRKEDKVIKTDKYTLIATDVAENGYVKRYLEVHKNKEHSIIGTYYLEHPNNYIEKVLYTDNVIVILRRETDWLGEPPELDNPPTIELLFDINEFTLFTGSQNTLLNLYQAYFRDDDEKDSVKVVNLETTKAERLIRTHVRKSSFPQNIGD